MTDHQAKALQVLGRQLPVRRGGREAEVEGYLRQVADYMAASEDEGRRVVGGVMALRLSGDGASKDMTEFMRSLRAALDDFDRARARIVYADERAAPACGW